MGCASSVDATAASTETSNAAVSRELAYATAVDAAFETLSANAGVPEADYDAAADADAMDQWQLLADEWSIHSFGDDAEEPSDFTAAFERTKAIAIARVRHGINSDPNQFDPGREPRNVMDSSIRQVDSWLRSQQRFAMRRSYCGGDSSTTASSSFPLLSVRTDSSMSGTYDGSSVVGVQTPILASSSFRRSNLEGSCVAQHPCCAPDPFSNTHTITDVDDPIARVSSLLLQSPTGGSKGPRTISQDALEKHNKMVNHLLRAREKAAMPTATP